MAKQPESMIIENQIIIKLECNQYLDGQELTSDTRNIRPSRNPTALKLLVSQMKSEEQNKSCAMIYSRKTGTSEIHTINKHGRYSEALAINFG